MLKAASNGKAFFFHGNSFIKEQRIKSRAECPVAATTLSAINSLPSDVITPRSLFTDMMNPPLAFKEYLCTKGKKPIPYIFYNYSKIISANVRL
jgi:hypothetical protein